MLTRTSAEAQNQFGQLLDLVQREPVAITRHGRPAAFIVSPNDMAEMLDWKRRQRAVKEFQQWSEKFRAQISPEAVNLTDEEINRMVHEVRAELRSR
jgi:prevent-host-death family protein